jgi:hypothetical protein
LECGPDGLLQMSAESLVRGRTAVREPPMRGARKPQDDHRGLANAPTVRFRQSEEGRPPQSFAPSSSRRRSSRNVVLEAERTRPAPAPPKSFEPYGPQSIAPSEASASAVRSGSQSSSRFRISNTSFPASTRGRLRAANPFLALEPCSEPVVNTPWPLTRPELTAKMHRGEADN